MKRDVARNGTRDVARDETTPEQTVIQSINHIINQLGDPGPKLDKIGGLVRGLLAANDPNVQRGRTTSKDRAKEQTEKQAEKDRQARLEAEKAQHSR